MKDFDIEGFKKELNTVKLDVKEWVGSTFDANLILDKTFELLDKHTKEPEPDKEKELEGAYDKISKGDETWDDGDMDCHNCEGPPINDRMWWEEGTYEYPDEGKLLCDACAYHKIHEYDDFDAEAFQKISDEKAIPLVVDADKETVILDRLFEYMAEAMEEIQSLEDNAETQEDRKYWRGKHKGMWDIQHHLRIWILEDIPPSAGSDKKPEPEPDTKIDKSVTKEE